VLNGYIADYLQVLLLPSKTITMNVYSTTPKLASLVVLMAGLLACNSSKRLQPKMEKEISATVMADTVIMAPGASPKLVSGQFAFTEGPAADGAGNVYFTDQPNDRIWKWSVDGQLSLFMEPSGRSNGMFFDRKGNLLSCADLRNEIWRIGPDKKVEVVLGAVGGKKLNGPNDLWSDADGGIFFTDPFYKRPWWDHAQPEMPGQYLYYLPTGAAQPRVVDTAYKQPNGIVGTPDGRYLYVADIGGNKTYRYDLKPGGQLSNRTLFAPMGSDGMTLDERGNLYLTGKGVTVFSPAGKKISHIDIPENWTANICFGGASRKTLFITASKSVYTVDMVVKGAW
jgi:gluconolactonase